MRIICLSIFLMLCLNACTPKIGVGIGGIVASEDGITASGIYADSETGIHGSVAVGTDIRL